MSEAFYKPQRQSRIGILLIFATSLFHVIRNFWVLGVYFLVQDLSPLVLFLSAIGMGAILLLALGYSIAYYYKFLFHIDMARKEFVLQKGVFSSEVISVPLNKIQQVNFNRNILQRIIGVYSVHVDTAGGKDKEVEIKALSREKADHLSEVLMELAGQEGGPALGEETRESASTEDHVDWQYSLGIRGLIKLGLTSNYLRGLALLFTFYITLREQFRMTEGMFEEIPEFLRWELTSSVILFVLLLLVGMAITVAETFIKYYRLQLRKTGAGLQVEMGLRNHTRVNIRPRRVQMLQILTNPLQRSLDLYKLKVSLASSQNDLHKDQITIPGMPRKVVSDVKEFFYGSEMAGGTSIRPHRILLYRKLFHGLLPLGIGLALLEISRFEPTLEWIYVASSVYLVLMVLHRILYFRSLRLSVSENFLIKHSGVWIRKRQVLEMYKLQTITLSQPIWYRNRRLVNLRVHSAGGDFSFSLVSKEEILPLLNYLYYKIESTSSPWM